MTGAVIYTINSGCVPPVDYVLEVYGDTSPAELYGGTVWMPLRDCIIMAAGDTFTAGTAGGSATAILTTAELPSHTHSGSTSSDGAHTHTVKAMMISYWQGRDNDPHETSGNMKNMTTSSAGAHTHTVTVGSTGGGQAWSLMNPYEAVNFWQRVG